jgi:hypothetical protein
VTGWVAAVEGTPEGRDAAMALALLAAVAHAVFGALQKGRHDPWLSRGAIDGWIFLLSAPVALFVVPGRRAGSGRSWRARSASTSSTSS